MDFQSILDADVRPSPDLRDVPSDPALRRVAAATRALVEADARLKRALALVEQIRKRRTELSTVVLPELMDTIGLDSFGVAEAGCDVVIETQYHAVIRADWPPEARQAAFDHLDALGRGDMIKSTIALELPREEYHRAEELVDAIKLWLRHKRLDATPTLRLDVHHATLTAFVRDYMEQPRDPHAPVNDGGVRMNLATLGATVLRVCRIVLRKASKPARGRRR